MRKNLTEGQHFFQEFVSGLAIKDKGPHLEILDREGLNENEGLGPPWTQFPAFLDGVLEKDLHWTCPL